MKANDKSKITMIDHYHGQLSGKIHFNKDEVKVVGQDVTKDAAQELVDRDKAVWGAVETPVTDDAPGGADTQETKATKGKTLQEAIVQSSKPKQK